MWLKVGDLVIGSSVNKSIEGRLCRITAIEDNIIIFDLKNGPGWLIGYNVATPTVFRKLTKLDKALQ